MGYTVTIRCNYIFHFPFRYFSLPFQYSDGTELYDMHDIVAVCPWMVVNSIQMC